MNAIVKVLGHLRKNPIGVEAFIFLMHALAIIRCDYVIITFSNIAHGGGKGEEYVLRYYLCESRPSDVKLSLLFTISRKLVLTLGTIDRGKKLGKNVSFYIKSFSN